MADCMKEPTKPAKSKSSKNRLFKLSVLLLAVYLCISAVSLQVEINQKEKQLEELIESCEQVELENADIRRIISSSTDEDYIELYAREMLDFVYPDERVFIDISGN